MKWLFSLMFLFSMTLLAEESDYEPGQLLLKPKDRQRLYQFAAAQGFEKNSGIISTHFVSRARHHGR
jgi:hypothetical protein